MEEDMVARTLKELSKGKISTIAELVEVLGVQENSLRTLLRRVELSIPDYVTVSKLDNGVKHFTLLTSAEQAIEAWRNCRKVYGKTTRAPRIPKQEKLPPVEKEVPTDIRVTLPELVVRVFVSVNITFGKGE